MIRLLVLVQPVRFHVMNATIQLFVLIACLVIFLTLLLSDLVEQPVEGHVPAAHILAKLVIQLLIVYHAQLVIIWCLQIILV